MTDLPDDVKTWLDNAEYVTVGTVLPNGQPHLSVLWATRDGDDILLSTLEGRQKFKNLTNSPRITVSLFPKDNPFAYAEVRGTATMTREGGRELIEALSQKYVGQPYPVEPPEDIRTVIRVKAEKVFFRG